MKNILTFNSKRFGLGPDSIINSLFHSGGTLDGYYLETSTGVELFDMQGAFLRKITKDPQFYNKDWSLTAYALACGYCERFEDSNRWKTLYSEHSHYHVQSGPANGPRSSWEVFSGDELTKARKLYKSL